MKYALIILMLIISCLVSACERAEMAQSEIENQGPATKETGSQEAVKQNQIKARPAKKPARQADIKNPAASAPPLPASQITKREGRKFNVRKCINLGNALEADYEGEWGYKIRFQDLQAIKRAGFDTVRLPVKWSAHTAHSPPYKIDERFLARVIEISRQANNLGLGIIIDVHHYEKLMQNPRREEKRFMAIWEQIAKAFAGAPDNVYFELLNEPTNQVSNNYLSQLYANTIKTIRKTNPGRKIIIGGNSWNSIEAMAKIRWPEDKNIIATFHDYSPHEFTHQGAGWTEPKYPMGRKYGTRADLADLQNIYAQARRFKARTGIPVLVGEFGVINKVPLSERTGWIRQRRKTMEANGLGWCVWDFAGAFNIYNTKTNEWLAGMQGALFAD